MPKRLFVAIDLPESTRQLLVNIDPQIRGVRWIDAAQMHLTLAFFGDVAEIIDSALREKLNTIEFGAGVCAPSQPPLVPGWRGSVSQTR